MSVFAVPTGLVAYFSFDADGISGSSLLDIAGNTKAGVIANGTKVAGQVGGALSFSGTSTSNVIWSTTNISPAGTSRTVSAWVKPASTSRGGIFSTGANVGTAGFLFTVNRTTAGNLSYIHDAGTICQFAAGITAGSWFHIVASYNKAAATASLYCNGALVGTTTSVSAEIAGSTGTSVANETYDANNNPYSGIIDDLRLYNRPLDATEVQKLYAAGLAGRRTPAGLNIIPMNALLAPSTGGFFSRYYYDMMQGQMNV